MHHIKIQKVKNLLYWFIVTLLLLCTMSDRLVDRPWQKSNGNRPKYSYFTMISMAIQHQEDQKATTQDIYKFIRDSFPYYRDFPDRKWQNAVRYTLSTNDCFVKVKPNHGRKYFSSYWIIHKDSHSLTRSISIQ